MIDSHEQAEGDTGEQVTGGGEEGRRQNTSSLFFCVVALAKAASLL